MPFFKAEMIIKRLYLPIHSVSQRATGAFNGCGEGKDKPGAFTRLLVKGMQSYESGVGCNFGSALLRPALSYKMGGAVIFPDKRQQNILTPGR